MLVPTFTAWWYDEADFGAWLVTSLVTWISSWWMVGAGRKAEKRVGEREGYVIVATVWIVFSLFGMLPFWMSGALPNLTDAWYETMAGFTTTGSTVFTDVADQTHSILLWRSLMQWVGGMGIIVLSVAILPMFGLGGMQLYSAEVTGVSYEKLSPRIADTAKHMWLTYIGLTVGEGILLWLFGMNKFDSLCYSMATISTGGFATHNDSLMSFNPAIQWTIFLFMLLSAINFTQLIYLFRGKPQRLIKDEETRWYVGACFVFGLILAVGLLIHTHQLDSIRLGLFTAVSTITSTGFVASDYMLWPPVLWMIVFFMMFTGGSSGSTAGGIKWIRLAIFAKSANAEIKRRIHPNAVIPVRFNGMTMSESATSNIVAFMFFYAFIIILASISFCACGIGFDESIGIAVSMIGNVGVSIGQWGSSGCYEALPDVAKWVATFVMLIGRLEIFTILLLFSRSLWRR